MIAQFARSSRTWTVVAMAIVLTLGLVALTDAVKAEDTPKPATRPTFSAEPTPGAATDGASSQTPAPSEPPAKGEELTNEHIAQFDPTMAQYLQRLAQLRLDREREKTKVGQQHPQVAVKDEEIRATEQLVAALAEQYRARWSRPAGKIKAGDLVLVSVMNLVGNGIETSKTTRVDGDGNIGLPYIGEIKAQGLKSNELEQAIAKAYKEKGVMNDAMVAVSLPARGESHQLAARREPAQNEPFAADPAMAGLEPSAVPIAAPPAAPGLAAVPGADPALQDVPIDPAMKAALDKKLPEVKLDQVPLGDAIDFLRDVTSINIFVNWRALKEAGVEQASPVTLKVKDVALKDVLALILKEQDDNIQYRVENGVITIDDAIVRTPRPKMVTKAYDVRDLLPGAPQQNGLFGGGDAEGGAMGNLTKTICDTVAPESWRVNGGVGSISAYGTKLVVTASDETHGEVANLLEMLRDKPATQPAAGSHSHEPQSTVH